MAEEEAPEGQEAPPPAKKPASGKNPLVTLLLIVNAIGIGVIGFTQFQLSQKLNSQPSIRDVVKGEMKEFEESQAENPDVDIIVKKKSEGILLPLQGFTANLAQGDGPQRFVRLNAVLKFDKTSKEEEFKARKPQIRDSIISILNSKRPEDLLNKEGKNYLKEEIKSSINSFLVDGRVIDIFYVGFQIN